MKKILMALLFASSTAMAGTVVVPAGMPIITPDIATGYNAYTWSAVSPEGERLVCPYSDWYSRGGKCVDKEGRNRWTRLKDIVPAGKTYAGFSINPHSGTVYVYWK